MITSDVAKKIKGLTLLIVEDEVELRNLLGSSFQAAGCKVHLTANGSEALSLLRRNSVDVLITDARMPVLSGAELVERLDQLTLLPPVLIIMSGLSDVGEDFFFTRGAYAFFEKPVSTQELASAIVDALVAPELLGRKFPRKRISALAEVSRKELSSPLEGVALNLSKGGVFVLSREALPGIDETVQISVSLDISGDSIIQGSAICRWWRAISGQGLPPGIGLQFKDLTPESQALLERLLRN